MNSKKLKIKTEIEVYQKFIDELNKQAENVNDKDVKGVLWTKAAELRDKIFQLEWSLKDSNMKHTYRIRHLSMVKTHGGNTKEELLNIEIYEKIRQAIPYILAMNDNGIFDYLMALCNEELAKIDSTFIFHGEHVSKDEVELAFKVFNLIKQNNEIELYPHYEVVKEKLDNLYDFLKNISSPQITMVLPNNNC